MNNPTNKKVPKSSDSTLKMCSLVFVLNLGISIIHLKLGGLEGFKAAFPAWVGLFMVCAMGIIIGVSLLNSYTQEIRQRMLSFVLVLLGTHEVYYLVRWKSPSIQLLSFLLLLIGMQLGKRSRKTS